MNAVPRLAWLSLLLPLACFSEGDVTPGGSESSEGASSTFTTTTATTSPETTESGPGSSSESTTATSATTVVDESSGEPTTDPTTSTATDTTETGDECPPGSAPIPPLPIGWEGVFTLSPGGTPKEVLQCPPELSAVGEIIQDAFAAPCSCECDPACWVYTDAEGDCLSFEGAFETTYDENCSNADVVPAFVSFDTDLAQDGGCDFPQTLAVIEGTRRNACEHTDGTPCVPAPPGFLAPCIRHAGDLACPAGPFTNRVLTVESLDVDCAPCDSCESAAIDACLAGSATLFSEADCGGDEVAVSSFACSPESGASIMVDFELACPSSNARQQGSHGERTYCCVE